MPFDASCPDCKIPGDDCPLGKFNLISWISEDRSSILGYNWLSAFIEWKKNENTKVSNDCLVYRIVYFLRLCSNESNRENSAEKRWMRNDEGSIERRFVKCRDSVCAAVDINIDRCAEWNGSLAHDTSRSDARVLARVNVNWTKSGDYRWLSIT